MNKLFLLLLLTISLITGSTTMFADEMENQDFYLQMIMP